MSLLTELPYDAASPGIVSPGSSVPAAISSRTAEASRTCAGTSSTTCPKRFATAGASLLLVAVSALVIEGSFRRVQHVLLALSAIFVTYVVAGLLVAIPSMFGYNWLVHNLRVLTVEMDNFAQQRQLLRQFLPKFQFFVTSEILRE